MSPRERRALLALILIVAPLLSLGLVWLFGPARVGATGSLTIPNTLANLAAGDQPLSVIDTNFTAIRTYVNEREMTVGLFSARPVASISGRYYYATDVAGGTLYFDTGSAWVQLGGPVNASGSVPNVRGLVGGTASLTVVNASAALVNVRSPSDGSVVVRTATGTLSNDALTTGANGRDQTAQFTANSWAHVYYIWNGSALATLSSACAPSDVNGACSSNFGPNLPSGYTHWAYIGAWRVLTNNIYATGTQRGASFFYHATQPSINSGANTSETSIDIASLAAPNAIRVRANARILTTGGSNVGDYAAIRLSPSQNFFQMGNPTNVANSAGDTQLEFPNIQQQYRYIIVTSGTPPTLSVAISGFVIPNGGD